jgi:SAM-dependent methyltransferase
MSRWSEEFSARARAYWTEERTEELIRGKRVLLPPAEAAPLLRAVGLLHRDASLPPTQARKYFQINHMVALLLPAIRQLRARHQVIRLLDAGCGRSYLSLLLAWCGRHVWNHPIEVLGVDRDAAIIDEGRRRAELAGLDDVVRFEVATLDTVDAADRHGVLALHACDTATCDAIALGVAARAEVIAVAPCCQAELARAWAGIADHEGAFAPIWRTPHLRREIAARVTDTMRTLLLGAAGYEVSTIEFVPVEHSAKNTLIRALRARDPDPAARAAYDALVGATGGVGIGLGGRV